MYLIRTSGHIRTVSGIDYEKQPVYNLVIEAVDVGGRRGVASVEVRERVRERLREGERDREREYNRNIQS